MNKNADNFALAGFILGLVALFFIFISLILSSGIWLISVPAGVVGIVLSALALKSTNKRNFALAGLICSIIAAAICLILLLCVACACSTYYSSTSYWWR